MDVKLTAVDHATTRDEFKVSLPTRVIVREEGTGRLVCDKSNLIVLRGRTFLLERLFNTGIVDNDPIPYGSNTNRKIAVFKVGQGGCPYSLINGKVVSTDPFTPVVVQHDELDLKLPIPFRVVDPAIPDSVMLPSEVGSYFGKRSNGTTDLYDLKTFEQQDASNGVWNIVKVDTGSISGGSVYRMLKLRLDSKDLRYDLSNLNPLATQSERDKFVPFVNELGLFFVQENKDIDGNIISYTEPEMFSRITFPTEPMAYSSNKALTIEYYVYA
jgi:hypothetical protein